MASLLDALKSLGINLSSKAAQSGAAPAAAPSTPTPAEQATASDPAASAAMEDEKAEDAVPPADDDTEEQATDDMDEDEVVAAAPVALGRAAYVAMALGLGVSKKDAEKAADDAVAHNVDAEAFLAGAQELAKQNKPRGSKPVPAASAKPAASSNFCKPHVNKDGECIPGAVFSERSGPLYDEARKLAASKGLNMWLAMREVANLKTAN